MSKAKEDAVKKVTTTQAVKKPTGNEKLKTSILEHIRDERKFNSLPDLQAQLEKDKLFSLNYIQNLK